MVQYVEILIPPTAKDFDKLYLDNFKDEFPLPSNQNSTTIRAVYEKGNPIAAGMIKLFTEAIIVTDQKAPVIQRMRAIDMLMIEMLKWCDAHDVEQVNAFVKPNFANFLMKRYGFEKTKDISLVLNVRG